MIARRCLLLGLITAITTARAAEITIVALSPFGQPLRGCKLESFRRVGDALSPGEELKSHFRGMKGKLPVDDYVVEVTCGKDALLGFPMVNRSDFVEVLTSGHRFMNQHLPEQLVIKLDSPRVTNETWWISVAELYGLTTDRLEFAPASDKAVIFNPQTGSYVVTVASTTGFSCVREVDLVELTRNWTFHPATCSWDFDRFAHLVQDEDKRSQKQSGWYAEMRPCLDNTGCAAEATSKK